MKVLIKYNLSIIVFLSLVNFSFAQNYNLNVGVYYTTAAKADVVPTIENQRAKVQSVLDNLNFGSNQNYRVNFNIFAELENYIEPKNRGKDYILYKQEKGTDEYEFKRGFQGTAQVLEEMQLMYYLDVFYKRNPTWTTPLIPSIPGLTKNRLATNFIETHGKETPQVNIFVVDEVGEPFALTPNVLEVAEFNSKAPGSIENSIYAVIEASEFENNPNALAIAIFSLLANPDEATPLSTNEFGYFSTYTLLGHWFEEGKDESIYPNALKLELSPQNKILFRCNIGKLNLISDEDNIIQTDVPDLQEDLMSLEDIQAQIHINKRDRVVLSSRDNDYEIPFTVKRRRTGEPDSYASLTTIRTEVNAPGTCSYNPLLRSITNEEDVNGQENSLRNNKKETLRANENGSFTEVFPPYPNPTNGDITFDMNVAKPGIYQLGLYDITGQQVDILFNGNIEKGKHQINANLSGLMPGIYIYSLQSGIDFPATGRIIIK